MTIENRTPRQLVHWTCTHGAIGIESSGFVLPMGMHYPQAEDVLGPEAGWLAGLAWYTDLRALPSPDVLGLTSIHIACDRTQHSYEVQPAALERALWWPKYVAEGTREGTLPDSARMLSFAPGAMPAHWWVSRVPMPIVRAQVPA